MRCLPWASSFLKQGEGLSDKLEAMERHKTEYWIKVGADRIIPRQIVITETDVFDSLTPPTGMDNNIAALGDRHTRRAFCEIALAYRKGDTGCKKVDFLTEAHKWMRARPEYLRDIAIFTREGNRIVSNFHTLAFLLERYEVTLWEMSYVYDPGCEHASTHRGATSYLLPLKPESGAHSNRT